MHLISKPRENVLKEIIVYHVVTDRPVQIGQHIIFNRFHHNGIWKRVHDKLNIINDIDMNPDKYNPHTFEHHTSVALRKLALEEVRQNNYPIISVKNGMPISVQHLIRS